jgi:hypothetical protein
LFLTIGRLIQKKMDENGCELPRGSHALCVFFEGGRFW